MKNKDHLLIAAAIGAFLAGVILYFIGL